MSDKASEETQQSQPTPAIRDVCEADFPRIVELNRAEEHQTSPMDLDRLDELHALAAYHRVATFDAEIAAFLLVMGDGASYENDNFGWFASRYDRFLYVDRIVVGSGFPGLGIGSLLYKDLFASASAQGVPVITCEYNIEPPNPASKRFHDKFGFVEVGQQHVAGGSKLVSLQVAEA